MTPDELLREHGVDLTIAVRSLAVETARQSLRFPTIETFQESAVKWSRLGDLLEQIRRDLDRDRHPSNTDEPGTHRLAGEPVAGFGTIARNARVRLHSGAQFGTVHTSTVGESGSEYVLVDWDHPHLAASWHYLSELVVMEPSP